MWRKFIQGLKNDVEFGPPVSEDRLVAAEAALGIAFPDELRSLLGETDGVVGEYGLGLVWPLDQIVKDNLEFRGCEGFRDLYMPFDCLLFFGDAGNGDQFAFPIQADGAIHRSDVFAWTHEDDGRKWIASSLKSFLERWSSGKIEL